MSEKINTLKNNKLIEELETKLFESLFELEKKNTNINNHDEMINKSSILLQECMKRLKILI